MKRLILPIYSVVATAIIAVFLVLGSIADRIIDSGTYLYTGLSYFTIDDLRLLILWIVVILVVSAILAILLKNIKKKWRRIWAIFVTTIPAVLILFQFSIGIGAFAPRAYVELISDDGQHHIVIAEDCYLFSPYGGDIFEMTSPHTMKKLAKYPAAIDYYSPFSNNNYSVTWNDKNFELFYDSDGDWELDKNILVKYL